MGQFGDKFRKAREAKNLSLDNVSNVTKIASRMLQAIEEEHFDQLPGGVFNRGFIRAYAKHLGLDAEDAVTEYLACLRQAQVDAQTVQYERSKPAAPEKRPLVAPDKQSSRRQPPAPSQIRSETQVENTLSKGMLSKGEELPDLQLPRAEHVRPPRKDYPEGRDSGLSWKLLAAALVLVLVFVLWRNYRGTRAASPPTASAASPNASVEAGPKPSGTPPSASRVTAAARPAVSVAASQTASPVIVPPAAVVHATPVASTPAKTSMNAAGDAATQNAAGVGSAADGNSNKETKGSTGDSGESPARSTRITAKPAATLTLVIRASETSWISVTADGQTVTQEKLIAPAHTSVRASHEISVRVGNAAGVSFLWNGAEIPAQGSEAEVKTYVFDTEGMRVLEAAPTSPQNP